MIGEIVSPKEMHDKCDLSEIDMNLYQTCDLFDNYILECSTDKCGGQKQVCDCNVYEWVYQWKHIYKNHVLSIST